MTEKYVDSIEEVSDWLCQLGYERFVQRFIESEIDGDVLPDLDINDLTTMQIPIGPEKKILKAIAEANSNRSTDSSPRSTKFLAPSRETKSTPLPSATSVPSL